MACFSKGLGYFFTGQHAFVLEMMLANIDHLTAQIDKLSAKIEVLCEPYLHQISQLDAVPGFGIITAQDIIAEIGTDMTVFPTAGHLASRARRCPQPRPRHRTARCLPLVAAVAATVAVS